MHTEVGIKSPGQALTLISEDGLRFVRRTLSEGVLTSRTFDAGLRIDGPKYSPHPPPLQTTGTDDGIYDRHGEDIFEEIAEDGEKRAPKVERIRYYTGTACQGRITVW